jgi:hypothetical protein
VLLRRRFVLFALVLGLGFSATALSQELAAPRPGTIVIENPEGSRILAVEIADTPALRSRGLMFRHRLADDKGMLFLYEAVQPVAMWMKNTYIPLDMVFLRADGSIAEVAENTVPHSLDTIQSREAVAAVLEVAAGQARRLGLSPGALVRHPFFGNAD